MLSNFRIRLLWDGLLVLLLVGAACSDRQPGWVTYEHTATGVSFDIPEEWVVSDELDDASTTGVVLTLANSAESLGAETLTGAGGTVLIASAQEFSGESDPLTLLGFFVQLFTTGDNAIFTEAVAPQALTINGQSAATASYAGRLGEQAGVFNFTTVVNGPQIVVLILVDATPGEFGATLEQIQQSLKVGG